jgi:hypothetical protein
MKTDKLFVLWFIFCAIVGVAWLAFLGWCLWMLVNWVVTL